MSNIPSNGRAESTLHLLADPYRFIGREARRLGTDVFQARLLLSQTICMTGPQAAELSYDTHRFQRRGAAPMRLKLSLFGRGAIQTLDDQAHRHRKRLLMALAAGPGQPQRLASLAAEYFDQAVSAWSRQGRVTLYQECQQLLARAACEWAGVPVSEDELPRRASQLRWMFDGAGAVGPRHWLARLSRHRGERWIEDLVRKTRAGTDGFVLGAPAYQIATAHDENGQLYSVHTAAVEIINLLRPIVAVSVYMTHVAHALHTHPETRDQLASDEALHEPFVHEVRRVYPFMPGVVAMTRQSFEWNGYSFPEGVLAVLDLYGTNQDARSFSEPDAFRPERFLERTPGPFEFVPQGGGEHQHTHRCAGEWMTVALMKMALQRLLRLRYELPEQSLDLDFGRVPALPTSGVTLENVRAPR